MPHKHKRRIKDDSDYNLPPTKIAKSLPARQKTQDSKGDKTADQTKKQKKTKKPQSSLPDDTPKTFARLLQRYEKNTKPKQAPKSDTDGHRNNHNNDGENQSRKRKRGGDNDSREKQKAVKQQQQSKPSKSTEKTTTEHEVPKILPGERMSDFAARVDRSMPLAMVSKTAATSEKYDPKDAKVRKLREDRQTKHERRLRRMQQEWRVEDAKIRAKREEEMEERDAANEEIDEQWKEWEREAGKSGKKKSKGKKKGNKKKKGPGGDDDDDDDKYFAASDGEEGDPWAKLNQKARSSNPFDVVQAPPEKLKKPREIFKVHRMGGAKVHVADVPTAAGSLRRREELATERQTIVEEYRKLMASKRGR